MSEKFYGLTKESLASLAFELAERNNIQHSFNKELKMAGKDWINGFLKRNPRLSIRTPESTSIARAKSFNKTAVDIFFNNLHGVIGEWKIKGHRIYNMDEMGITVVPNRESKIIAKKGTKQVGKMSSEERGALVTVIACFGISQFIPPMFIFPKKPIFKRFLDAGPVGSLQTVSDSGWTNEDIFLEWLQHFNSTTNPTADDPVLLIMDNHGSHISWKAVEFCQNHFIHLLTLPPHCSHKLQPCDVGLFGPIKRRYPQAVSVWMSRNKTKKLSMCHIPSLLKEPYQKAASIELAVNSFKKCGIWCTEGEHHGPNRDVFTDADFSPSSLFPEEVSEDVRMQHVVDVINNVAQCSDQGNEYAEIEIDLEMPIQNSSGYESFTSTKIISVEHLNFEQQTGLEPYSHWDFFVPDESPNLVDPQPKDYSFSDSSSNFSSATTIDDYEMGELNKIPGTYVVPMDTDLVVTTPENSGNSVVLNSPTKRFLVSPFALDCQEHEAPISRRRSRRKGSSILLTSKEVAEDLRSKFNKKLKKLDHQGTGKKELAGRNTANHKKSSSKKSLSSAPKTKKTTNKKR